MTVTHLHVGSNVRPKLNVSVPDLTTEGFGMHKFSAEATFEPAIANVVTKKAAALAAVDLYGSSASLAAAHCALEARYDGRDDDYRFWVAVFKLLSVKSDAITNRVNVTEPC